MVAASITVLRVEGPAGGSILTGADALWWSLVTVTSVGYGDMVPVTPEGRLVATALMTIGVMLFGTMTAWLAAWFVKPGDEAQDAEIAAIRSEEVWAELGRRPPEAQRELLERLRLSAPDLVHALLELALTRE